MGVFAEPSVGDPLRAHACFAELWDYFAIVAQHASVVGAQVYVDMPRSRVSGDGLGSGDFLYEWNMVASVITDACMDWQCKMVLALVQ